MKLKTYIRNLKQYVKMGGVVYMNITNIDPKKRFDGKKIFIVNGCNTFGIDLALRFEKEGAKVLISGCEENSIKGTKNRLNSENIKLVKIDTSDYDNISNHINEVITKYDDFNIFINNTKEDDIEFMDITEDYWNKIISIYNKEIFFICQEEGSYLYKLEKGGKIINIPRVNICEPKFTPQFAAIYGMDCMTKGLAKQLADKDITVNCVEPKIITQSKAKCNITENIINVTMFLASDCANNITGQTISVNGVFCKNG